MPRELLKAAKVLADSQATEFDSLNRPKSWNNENFNHSAYNEIGCCILEHAKKYQTSEYLARHLLKIVNISNIKTVLVLGEYPNYDYMVNFYYLKNNYFYKSMFI